MINENKRLNIMFQVDVQENIDIIWEGILELNSAVLQDQYLPLQVKKDVFDAFKVIEIIVYRAIIYDRFDILKLVESKLAYFDKKLLNVTSERNNYEFIQILHYRIVALLDFIIKQES